MLGAAAGLALVWVVGAAALLLPGQRSLRKSVQRSEVLRRLNDIVPPGQAAERPRPRRSVPVDRRPGDPDRAARRPPCSTTRRPCGCARASSACSAPRAGSGISGSGWVAAPGVVVTAAHVVAGERTTYVVRAGSEERCPRDGDRVRLEERRRRPPRARPRAPPAADGRSGAGRVGRDRRLPAERPARHRARARRPHGHGADRRRVRQRPGRSARSRASPARSATATRAGRRSTPQGRVQLTIFAARVGDGGGYGIPAEVVRKVLAVGDGPGLDRRLRALAEQLEHRQRLAVRARRRRRRPRGRGPAASSSRAWAKPTSASPGPASRSSS